MCECETDTERDPETERNRHREREREREIMRGRERERGRGRERERLGGDDLEAEQGGAAKLGRSRRASRPGARQIHKHHQLHAWFHLLLHTGARVSVRACSVRE